MTTVRGKEAAIRAAMERLLAGAPLCSSGRLDVSTLAKEAGVSRQDLYRTYASILNEFRSQVERIRTVGPAATRIDPAAQAAQLRDAAERATRYRKERDEARRERDANASRVVYLQDQNRQLQEALNSFRGVATLFSQSEI